MDSLNIYDHSTDILWFFLKFFNYLILYIFYRLLSIRYAAKKQ